MPARLTVRWTARAPALALALALTGIALGARPALAEPPAGEPPEAAPPAAAPPAASPSEASPSEASRSVAPPPALSEEESARAWTEEAGFPLKKVRLTGGGQNVVRTGPGDGFALLGVFPDGTTFDVIAKRDDWYNVRVSESKAGWIHSTLVKEFDDLSGLEFRVNPRMYSRIGAFVLGGYGGGYAFDRKSNSLALGGRIGYYVLDFLAMDGTVGYTRINRPQEIVESLFDLRLESEEFSMLYYSMNLLVELLPGRRIVPFVTGGYGSSILQGKTEPSINFGAGTLLFLSKSTGMRWEIKSYQFDSGSKSARRTNHNVEFTLGTSLLL
jgi:outer membrane beta-barrel protein